MTSTPKSTVQDDALGESWVDVSFQSPDRVTPLPGSIHVGDMQKLLWEAQRESNQSSARVSLASTRRSSPRSPPNSPNTELSSGVEDLRGYYINCGKDDLVCSLDRSSTEWVWDWSSRPDQQPPKEWKFQHPRKTAGLSMRHSKAVKCGLFSTEVLSIVVITNLFSLLLGAGIGYYIGKRLATVSALALD